jgi:hypothetical protein
VKGLEGYRARELIINGMQNNGDKHAEGIWGDGDNERINGI